MIISMLHNNIPSKIRICLIPELSCWRWKFLNWAIIPELLCLLESPVAVLSMVGFGGPGWVYSLLRNFWLLSCSRWEFLDWAPIPELLCLILESPVLSVVGHGRPGGVYSLLRNFWPLKDVLTHCAILEKLESGQSVIHFETEHWFQNCSALFLNRPCSQWWDLVSQGENLFITITFFLYYIYIEIALNHYKCLNTPILPWSKANVMQNDWHLSEQNIPLQNPSMLYTVVQCEWLC